MAMLWLVVVCLCALSGSVEGNRQLEATQWLNHHMQMVIEHHYEWYLANWQAQTNITTENEQKAADLYSKLSQIMGQAAIKARTFSDVTFSDDVTKRAFHFLLLGGGSGALTTAEVNRFSQLRFKMVKVINSAKIRRHNCTSDDCDLDNLGYRNTMNSVKDSGELRQYWEDWMDVAAKPNGETYPEFIRIQNMMANAKGFKSRAESLLFYYDDEDDFMEQCGDLWGQVKPLYQKLHNFIRHHLVQKYPEVEFPKSGHVPVHLLGGSMAAFWQHLYKDVEPFPNKNPVSFADQLLSQNYTPKKIYKLAESFFISLGFDPLPATFWNRSMFEKPTDGRDVVCPASAWDFLKNGETRIKHCGTTDEMTFNTAHHELGHIYYFMAYADQPYELRQGANPGFHEAIGDCISLSTETTHYLHSVSLVDSADSDEALHKLVLMPFTFLVDKWRYSVYRGETRPHEYTKQWWNLRCKYQGVTPPSPRSNDDFDPGELSHITRGTPYLRYFVSMVLQYQFHEALCKEAGHNGSLHTCDIYQSKAAGDKLWSLMKLGASKPWSEAMQMITGTSKMDAGPVLQYFKPLSDWLDTQNYTHVTWNEECPDASFTSGADVPHFTGLVILVYSCFIFVF